MTLNTRQMYENIEVVNRLFAVRNIYRVSKNDDKFNQAKTCFIHALCRFDHSWISAVISKADTLRLLKVRHLHFLTFSCMFLAVHHVIIHAIYRPILHSG